MHLTRKFEGKNKKGEEFILSIFFIQHLTLYQSTPDNAR